MRYHSWQTNSKLSIYPHAVQTTDSIVTQSERPYPSRHVQTSRITQFLCMVVVLFSGVLKAEEQEAESNSSAKHSPTLSWLIEKRNYWGKIVGNTGRRLDGFFANEEVIDETNDSFVKLGLEFHQYTHGTSYLKPDIDFRLDLPTLEEKLRLVFESEPIEKQKVSEKKRDQGSHRDSKDFQQSTVGALELKLENKRHYSSNTGVGLKLGHPWDPFWRYRVQGVYAFSEQWEIHSHDGIYFFHEEGWGSHLELSFQYNGPWYVARQTSDGRYDYKNRRWEVAHTYSFIQELSPIRAINYQIGLLGETQLDVQATGYFIHAIYRRKLHKEWLFYEMIPELFFAKGNDWNVSPSITFKIEMVLSQEEQ